MHDNLRCGAGMFLLLGVMAAWEDAGDRLSDWFAPALEWIQRWMALFYAPFLVALPANAASLIGEGFLAETSRACTDLLHCGAAAARTCDTVSI